jgi:hypothetical protein
MPSDVGSLTAALIESGRQEAIAEESDDLRRSLATLRFANQLRRAADQLCQEAAEAARREGGSWREIGEVVGGITPQGAEHRFSRAAKERRSKASKVEWAGKERRAIAR